MPRRAVAAAVAPPDLDENGCIPVFDPDDGALLGAVPPTEVGRRMMGNDPHEPIPLFNAGSLERTAFPANLPPDHGDPDSTMARVERAALLPDNGGIHIQLNLNPYHLLTNRGVEAQTSFAAWQVVLTSGTVLMGARMWGTATTNNNLIWDNWTQLGTSSTTTTVTLNSETWTQWLQVANGTDALAPQALAVGSGFYRRPLTTEQAERERAKYAEMERDRAAATLRATDLLRSVLDDEQEAELLTHARFHVRSQKGKLYRIRRGWSHSVDLIEDGVIKGTYCIHPKAAVPTEDSMVAQKLMLESAEDEFLRIANFSRAVGQRLA